jgi:CHAD domain-containing protein
MASSIQSIRPVATLREYITALDAAILLCLAKPGKRAVHELRTTTRRIEAQLTLLSMLPGLPRHDKLRRNIITILKKLRRAAGRVRDLDVQRDLVDSEAKGKSGKLREEAHQLRRELKRQRQTEATRLERVLHDRQARLPLLFEELLDALAPAQSATLTESQLTALIHQWYEHSSEQQPSGDPNGTNRLHTIRKRAKLARYLAESAPHLANNARRVAARFESLQQAGGEWHDRLLLAEVAAHELGKSAQLPQRFAAQADRSLKTYQRRLARKV